jgi:hypothetical protein
MLKVRSLLTLLVAVGCFALKPSESMAMDIQTVEAELNSPEVTQSAVIAASSDDPVSASPEPESQPSPLPERSPQMPDDSSSDESPPATPRLDEMREEPPASSQDQSEVLILTPSVENANSSVIKPPDGNSPHPAPTYVGNIDSQPPAPDRSEVTYLPVDNYEPDVTYLPVDDYQEDVVASTPSGVNNPPVSSPRVSKMLTAKKLELEEVRFLCGQDGTAPSTVAKIKDQNEVVVILWSSTVFAEAGYDPQTRCKQVSERFEQYQQGKALVYVTAGKINGQSVLCVTSKEDGGCGEGVPMSTQDGLLYTLKPGSDAKAVLEELAAALKSQDKATQKPLEE